MPEACIAEKCHRAITISEPMSEHGESNLNITYCSDGKQKMADVSFSWCNPRTFLTPDGARVMGIAIDRNTPIVFGNEDMNNPVQNIKLLVKFPGCESFVELPVEYHIKKDGVKFKLGRDMFTKDTVAIFRWPHVCIWTDREFKCPERRSVPRHADKTSACSLSLTGVRNRLPVLDLSPEGLSFLVDNISCIAENSLEACLNTGNGGRSFQLTIEVRSVRNYPERNHWRTGARIVRANDHEEFSEWLNACRADAA